MKKWIERIIFGETAEEHFERHPYAKSFTNRHGITTSNVRLLVKNFCEHPKCEGVAPVPQEPAK